MYKKFAGSLVAFCLSISTAFCILGEEKVTGIAVVIPNFSPETIYLHLGGRNRDDFPLNTSSDPAAAAVMDYGYPKFSNVINSAVTAYSGKDYVVLAPGESTILQFKIKKELYDGVFTDGKWAFNILAYPVAQGTQSKEPPMKSTEFFPNAINIRLYGKKSDPVDSFKLSFSAKGNGDYVISPVINSPVYLGVPGNTKTINTVNEYFIKYLDVLEQVAKVLDVKLPSMKFAKMAMDKALGAMGGNYKALEMIPIELDISKWNPEFPELTNFKARIRFDEPANLKSNKNHQVNIVFDIESSREYDMKVNNVDGYKLLNEINDEEKLCDKLDKSHSRCAVMLRYEGDTLPNIAEFNATFTLNVAGYEKEYIESIPFPILPSSNFLKIKKTDTGRQYIQELTDSLDKKGNKASSIIGRANNYSEFYYETIIPAKEDSVLNDEYYIYDFNDIFKGAINNRSAMMFHKTYDYDTHHHDPLPSEEYFEKNYRQKHGCSTSLEKAIEISKFDWSTPNYEEGQMGNKNLISSEIIKRYEDIDKAYIDKTKVFLPVYCPFYSTFIGVQGIVRLVVDTRFYDIKGDADSPFNAQIVYLDVLPIPVPPISPFVMTRGGFNTNFLHYLNRYEEEIYVQKVLNNDQTVANTDVIVEILPPEVGPEPKPKPTPKPYDPSTLILNVDAVSVSGNKQGFLFLKGMSQPMPIDQGVRNIDTDYQNKNYLSALISDSYIMSWDRKHKTKCFISAPLSDKLPEMKSGDDIWLFADFDYYEPGASTPSIKCTLSLPAPDKRGGTFRVVANKNDTLNKVYKRFCEIGLGDDEKAKNECPSTKDIEINIYYTNDYQETSKSFNLHDILTNGISFESWSDYAGASVSLNKDFGVLHKIKGSQSVLCLGLSLDDSESKNSVNLDSSGRRVNFIVDYKNQGDKMPIIELKGAIITENACSKIIERVISGSSGSDSQ